MEKKSRKGLIIFLVIVVILLLGVIAWLVFSPVPTDQEQTVTSQEDQEEIEEESEESEEPEEYEEADRGESFDRSAGNSGDTWTVLIYLCGSDLESEFGAATQNLIEIMSVKDPEKVNVLVETGGCEKWSDEAAKIDTKTLGFYSFDNDGIKLEKSEPSRSMGDPGNLEDFIAWGKETRPADKYMLIFWDHGGGSTSGVCFDDLYEKDCLTLAELKKAMAKADVPFEVIGFDACLMGSLETAEAVQGYGHYMVASEETEPGAGWDYTDFLDYLGNDTSMDGSKIGKRISDGFLEKCALSDEDSTATLSVVDLTKIPPLSSAYRNLSLEMVLSSQDSGSLRQIVLGARDAEKLGPNTDSIGYTNMIDLGDFVKKTDSVLNKNSAAVIKALEDAVVYETHGDRRTESHGLSVFYPIDVQDYQFDEYKNCANNDAFVGFTDILLGNFDSREWEENWEQAWKEAYGKNEINEGKYDSFFNNGQSIAADYNEPSTEDYYESAGEIEPVRKEDYKLKFTQETDDEGYHHLKITSGLDMVSAVDFLLYILDPDSGKYIYLGSDNNLEGDYDTGEFKEVFNGTWITIGGEFVYAELMEETEDYNLYSIPVLLNDEEKYLKAVYEYDKEAFRVLGAYDGYESENGYAGRDVRKLKKGDRIEFQFFVYDPEKEDDDGELVSISEIVWSDNTKMEDTELGDASVIYMFMISSIFGDEDFGDPIYMRVENGMITEE